MAAACVAHARAHRPPSAGGVGPATAPARAVRYRPVGRRVPRSVRHGTGSVRDEPSGPVRRARPRRPAPTRASSECSPDQLRAGSSPNDSRKSFTSLTTPRDSNGSATASRTASPEKCCSRWRRSTKKRTASRNCAVSTASTYFSLHILEPSRECGRAHGPRAEK